MTKPMDDKTLTALKGSIEKWKKIVVLDGVDRGTDNCPLCKVFYDQEDNGGFCAGCPVRAAVGASYCENSPYDGWRQITRSVMYPTADTPERVAAAQAELDFLISLLPEGEAP